MTLIGFQHTETQKRNVFQCKPLNYFKLETGYI